MVLREMNKSDLYTYRITWSEEDREYIGLCAEFPGLSWLADTKEEALLGINKVVSEVIADMGSNGETVPPPLSVKHYSGKFTVRVPAEIHRKLAIQAAESSVSFNRYISAKLAAD
jgi:predicted HicB family RNase H-like nuclease